MTSLPKRLMLSGFAAFSLVVLSACATPEPPLSEFGANLKQTQEKLDACRRAAAEKSQSRTRLARAMGTKSASLVLLVERDTITDEERVALLDYREARKPCRRLAFEEYGKFSPGHAEVYRGLFAQIDQTNASLMERQIAWGEANNLTLRHAFRLQAGFREIERAVADRSDVALVVQFGLSEEQEEAIEDWPQNEQILYSEAQPTYRDCSLVEATIVCSDS
ncbi:hypothetical protein [Algihabitans sp.]|uniref:hypothetical protein n=1 Tax=Algihabitans sp. TaxID=2821514 RepID=UPI003BA8D5EF